MRVQWKGDNLQEVEQLLARHLARVTPADDQGLHITGLDGMDVMVGLGDFIRVKRDSLGVERTTVRGDSPFVVWTGNAEAVAGFIKDWPHMEWSVTGNQLRLQWVEDRPRRARKLCVCYLNRGDRLLKKGRYLFVSRAGQDHRA